MANDTPTPEQIRQVLGYLSRQRTKEQRKGGRPKGFVMSEDSRKKISETKRARSGPERAM
jgi:hypothetical protein